jgi:hypothetical protein
MDDGPQAAWTDIDRRKRDREPEAPRPRAARIQVKHPVFRFDRRFVRMSRDDHIYSLSDRIDTKRPEIVEDIDSSRCESDKLGVGIVSRPVSNIHVARIAVTGAIRPSATNTSGRPMSPP